MAPKRPEKITPKVMTAISPPGVWSVRWTMPAPMVLATAVPNRNAAAKLKKADQMTALPGERTRVDTTVAIELAAS